MMTLSARRQRRRCSSHFCCPGHTYALENDILSQIVIYQTRSHNLFFFCVTAQLIRQHRMEPFQITSGIFRFGGPPPIFCCCLSLNRNWRTRRNQPTAPAAVHKRNQYLTCINCAVCFDLMIYFFGEEVMACCHVFAIYCNVL